MNNNSEIIFLIEQNLLKVKTIKKWKKTFPEYFFKENNSIQLF
jgi:hypothetical protein